MQVLTDSVGEKGVNKVHDVALVQAILVKTKRNTTPMGSYLDSYDGVCGDYTKKAIHSFQNDHVFVSANKQCAPNQKATLGLIKPNDSTWLKLIEKVPSEFSGLRVLLGGKIVYIAASENELQRKVAAVNALTFTTTFRVKVIACINRMHSLYGIAIGVCPQGDRRSFQSQYDLLVSGRGVTNAGPGESNHNFGMAVDLGFEGLRWLKKNGTVIDNETSWLHRLNPNQKIVNEHALKFWEVMRSVGTSLEVGAFRGPKGDHPHLQNWSDVGVSMQARLVDLLNRSGNMRWSTHGVATLGVYLCDLGMGGDLYPVGTAAQIWNRQAVVTVDVISHARAARLARLAHSGQQVQTAVPSIGPGAPLQQQQQPTVQPADVVALQRELRRQFELADANWQNWTPR